MYGSRDAVRHAGQKNERDGQRLVTGINCQPESVYADFMTTKRLHHKTDGVLFYHMDSTTMHPHTDRKTLRKKQQKKIAQGHAQDDHEEEQNWQQTM